jgi:hypothetical protein
MLMALLIKTKGLSKEITYPSSGLKIIKEAVKRS